MERMRVAQPAGPSRAARRAAPAGTGNGVLALQRSAGNAAVVSLIDAQRAPEDDDLAPWNGGAGAGADHADEGAAAPGPGEAGIPEGAAPAPAGGMNDLGPVARVGTLIADSIVATSYTPGAGNIW